MLLAIIRSALVYPTFTVGTITGTPEVRPSWSSRTRERSSQCNNVCTGYEPNCHPVQDAPSREAGKETIGRQSEQKNTLKRIVSNTTIRLRGLPLWKG
ncbi:hypothetical protein KSP40_PGU021784 [Platanthera guangdongensis]|uniref:Secreted protein n=1 Tax=Platanthera guangdongensis TaxID=2320717 RepID=A0ABR2M549_9ASPA